MLRLRMGDKSERSASLLCAKANAFVNEIIAAHTCLRGWRHVIYQLVS